jgi:HK97 family phage portal protein
VGIVDRALTFIKAQTEFLTAYRGQRKGVKPSDPVLAAIMRNAYGSEDKLSFPYRQIPVVYACIRAKAINVSQVPVTIHTIGSDDPIENHPIVDLFDTINPFINKYQLWEGICTMLDAYGWAPIMVDPQRVGNVPVALWLMHPKNVKVAKRNGVFIGFMVKINKQEVFVTKEDMIMPKYFNPYDDILGMSPTDPLKLINESEWEAIRFNKKFFDNGIAPGTVYSTEQNLTDEQFDRAHAQLIEARRGVSEAHKGLLLEGGLTLQNIRPSNRDLQFMEMRKMDREDVCMVYKVPKAEISLYEDINYATALSADLAFWKKTLMPIMKMIKDTFDKTLLNPLGFEMQWDFKEIDVLNSEVLEKAEAAQKFYEMGVPFNIINDRLGLDFPEIEDGDKPKKSGIPPQLAEAAEENPVEPETGSEEKALGADSFVNRAREKQWEQLNKMVLSQETQINRAIKDYFFAVRQRIFRQLVKNYGKENMVLKAGGMQDLEGISVAFSDEELAEAIRPHVEKSMTIGVESVNLGPDGFVNDKSVLRAVKRRVSKVVGINLTARDTVLRQIQEVTERIISGGLTEAQGADAMIEAVKEGMAIDVRRAKTIARTEVHGAFAEGRHMAAEVTEPKYKKWISARSNVRPSHVRLDGTKVRFYDNYENGLRFPHDPNGSAGEVINCRCVEVYLYGEDE